MRPACAALLFLACSDPEPGSRPETGDTTTPTEPTTPTTPTDTTTSTTPTGPSDTGATAPNLYVVAGVPGEPMSAGIALDATAGVVWIVWEQAIPSGENQAQVTSFDGQLWSEIRPASTAAPAGIDVRPVIALDSAAGKLDVVAHIGCSGGDCPPTGSTNELDEITLTDQSLAVLPVGLKLPPVPVGLNAISAQDAALTACTEVYVPAGAPSLLCANRGHDLWSPWVEAAQGYAPTLFAGDGWGAMGFTDADKHAAITLTGPDGVIYPALALSGAYTEASTVTPFASAEGYPRLTWRDDLPDGTSQIEYAHCDATWDACLDARAWQVESVIGPQAGLDGGFGAETADGVQLAIFTLDQQVMYAWRCADGAWQNTLATDIPYNQSVAFGSPPLAIDPATGDLWLAFTAQLDMSAGQVLVAHLPPPVCP